MLRDNNIMECVARGRINSVVAVVTRRGKDCCGSVIRVARVVTDYDLVVVGKTERHGRAVRRTEKKDENSIEFLYLFRSSAAVFEAGSKNSGSEVSNFVTLVRIIYIYIYEVRPLTRRRTYTYAHTL